MHGLTRCLSLYVNEVASHVGSYLTDTGYRFMIRNAFFIIIRTKADGACKAYHQLCNYSWNILANMRLVTQTSDFFD